MTEEPEAPSGPRESRETKRRPFWRRPLGRLRVQQRAVSRQLPPGVRLLLRLGLATFVMAAAGFLAAVTTIRLATQGRQVDVPSVVELAAGEAEAELAKVKLGFRIADRIYSELPADRVLRQSPRPGTTVKAGQSVHVVLSLGPRDVQTPLLEGKSLRAARVELLRAGLQLGQVSAVYLPGHEPDRVVRQYPPPRIQHAGSSRVSLLVSLGPREPAYVMADLEGLTLGEAQRRLSAAGLRMGRIQFVQAAGAAAGTVVAQRPRRGARVPQGAVVEVEIAEPPPLP